MTAPALQTREPSHDTFCRRISTAHPRFFKAREVRAGETLNWSDLATAFIEDRWQRTDFLSGMEYAAEQGLIEMLSADLVKLTRAGFEVM